jgi:AcrR family transcriptional regulator
MSARRAAMEATREAILDTAVELFTPRWYDEVTLAEIARAAGVSTQTVVNHFGGKSQLYLAGVAERVAPAIRELRSGAVPGDLPSTVDAVLTDYESTGEGTMRTLGIAPRIPELAEMLESGRTWHHEWTAEQLAPLLRHVRGRARTRVVRGAATVLDVTTWHDLRVRQGLSRSETRAVLLAILEPLVDRGRPAT